MTATNSQRRLILCAGLQSGGTTLISWCFLQREDTDGVLDMDNDILRVSFDRVKKPVCWVKMTVGAFRWLDVDELYRDLGWSPEPLLVVRDVRAAYGSLMKHPHGFNGLTAEQPPLRMRFRRFLRDWELFRANGWPIIKYEDFIEDHRAALMRTCQALSLAWDEGMIAWPKRMADIAYLSEANPTFESTLAKGNLTSAKLPDKAAIQVDGLPLSELDWLEATFAAYNDFHNYPRHIRPLSRNACPLTMPPLQWDGSSRERYYRLLSENGRLRAEKERSGWSLTTHQSPLSTHHLSDSGNRLSRLRIVVLGYLVRGPLGGLAWHHLQYVLGLAKLGHDVYFVEDSDDYPACYDPARHIVGTDPSYGLDFTGQAFTRLGLGGRWAYYDAHKTQWLGPCAGAVGQILGDADLLLNVSGVNPLRPWFQEIPVRVLVDTDPVFTQVRHLTDPAARENALGHTAFMTFGENIPGRRSAVPDDGLPWIATRQPVVLDIWPVSPGPVGGRFTTVMQWNSYPAREYAGRRFATKAESFMPYLDLPRRVGAVLELALGSAEAPRSLLEQKGWLLGDPLEVTRDPWTYQRYIQQSKAEFTIAKHGYVVSHSGWFSERSAAYLASGRPVITQDTGLSALLPTGTGLLTYTNPDEAVAAIEAVNRCYGQHCRAARDLAEAYFDARQVLPRLIDAAMKARIV